MTPPKTRCDICGKDMKVGNRVKIQMFYEHGREKSTSKATVICKRCARKLETIFGMR